MLSSMGESCYLEDFLDEAVGTFGPSLLKRRMSEGFDGWMEDVGGAWVGKSGYGIGVKSGGWLTEEGVDGVGEAIASSRFGEVAMRK